MALPEQTGEAHRRPTRRLWMLAVLAAVFGVALLAGGCGSDDDEASETTTAAATTGAGAPATVPDVEGAELAGAAEQLSEAGLRAAVKYVPSNEPGGQVIGQSRPPGSELQRGEAVSLNVSTGPKPAVIVTVPDATEQTEADGRAALEQAGFEVQTIEIPAVTEDLVVSQSPPAADRVPRGSLVLLYAGGS
jgi:eukaryotic-like serine/threonine-protein kinase